jgi:hypothetical protein
MKIALNSELFHVTQPCCYWVFQDYLYGIEQAETEYREAYAHEMVKMYEDKQPWLRGLDKRRFDGKQAYRMVMRKDLPKNHPEYTDCEQAELDWDKAKGLIAETWVETFEVFLHEKYAELGIDGPVTVVYTESYSPREYNYSGDKSVFTLTIPDTAMNKIISLILSQDREGFSKYLKKYHTSYDGYWSFLSNNIRDYEGYFDTFKTTGYNDSVDGIDHLIWAVLDYWLFIQGNLIDAFTADRWENVF